LHRIARIVRSLKEFSHPNAPDLTPVDLNRAIETAITVSHHEWKYVAKVVTEFTADLPPVPCILDEFNQVLLNLIVNAAQAIDEKSKSAGELQGLITIRTRLTEAFAVVEVEDNGPGIPQEHRARVFEPFFTTKLAGHGTGQGLAIVQNVIVVRHGGRVDFATKLGSGTVFNLYLPLTARKAPAPADPHP
ncbi:MAG: histidine kinase, partial [Opitutae bacterium]|nr:histidine kinase [Opitutae bacterium]